MGNVHPGPPLWLLDALKQTGRYRIFVETGTAQGDTALGAGSARDVPLVDDRLIAVPRAEAAVWSILIPDGRPGFLLPGHG